MIFKERIKQARELKRLTQAQLAALVGANQSTIAHFETGRAFPSVGLVELIANATGVEPKFFERPPEPPIPLGSLTYRSRSSVRAGERDQALQYLALLVEQMKQLCVKLNLPILQLPKSLDDPIQAARLTRVAFDIDPMRPVAHVIDAMERHGIVLFALPVRLEKIDAFSTWARIDDKRPIVAYSYVSAGDRLRFSSAHELGHLVMHKGVHRHVRELEREANQFAAEFLLPEQAMREVLTESLTLTAAATLKLRWRVSIQMLVRRARDLGIITQRRYRYLFEQIGARGWRKQEPGVVPIERPRLFLQMAENLYPEDCVIEMAKASDIELTLARELLSQYRRFEARSGESKIEDTELYQSDGWRYRN